MPATPYTHPDWLDRSEYPFAPHFFETDGHRLHYVDEGTGEVLLFVHGTPAWSFDWRAQIRALSGQYRCIAPDLLGFGLSDKPFTADYSLEAHLFRLDALINSLALRNITLVVHDFGGPIALTWALRHTEKVKGVVVLNSWMWSSTGDPDYEKLRRVLKSPVLPFLYRQLNFSPRFLLPASFGRQKPSKNLMRHYHKPFADNKQREGALAFARALLHDQPWFDQLWQQRTLLAQLPALIIWGEADPVIGLHQRDRWKQVFPNARTETLAGAGHFPQEEAAETVKALIEQFLHAPDFRTPR